jgi:two-component system alkaline phosphatase synthesis response regulator PhoP
MSRKILVVDDEIHILRVVAIKLKNNGFEVITAEDGKQGFETALAEMPDMIISDYQMPNMTGIEMVEKLRQNETTKCIPVIMLTARGFAIEDQQKQNLNIAEFLSKPFSPKELLNTVEEILQNCTIK